MPGRTCPRRQVPSEEWATLHDAIVTSLGPAVIEILPGHREELESLVLDQPFEIDGPADRSAVIVLEQGVICACSSNEAGSLILRNLQLQSTHGPTLTIAGPCSVEFCDISAVSVGVQILAGGTEEIPYLAQNIIHSCSIGLQLAASALFATLDWNRLERNSKGAVIVGLQIPEGESDSLAAFRRTHFTHNSVADIQLVSLSISERSGELVHSVCEDLCLQRVGEPCHAFSKTSRGTVSLRVESLQLRALLGESVELSAVGHLPARGRWCTGALPTSGSGLRELRRDFARLAAPGGQQALLVVGPEAMSAPTSWARCSAGNDVSADTADAAAADLARWLENALRCTPRAGRSGLADRCIALLGAGEGVSFTATHGLTPILRQPHFVLLVSSSGEVRVAWFVYVTDDARPDYQNGRWCFVSLLTEDLNSSDAVGEACTGVHMDFVASTSDEPDIAQIVARNTGALRRAADEGAWQLVLAAS